MKSLPGKRRRSWRGYKISKNLIISSLIIVIVVLVGVIILTNYNWFSQEWLLGLGIVIGGIGGEGLIIYLKIRR